MPEYDKLSSRVSTTATYEELIRYAAEQGTNIGDLSKETYESYKSKVIEEARAIESYAAE